MAELADAIALGAIGETRGGSNPLPRTSSLAVEDNAGVAQLVERYLAKVVVDGSIPFTRSIFQSQEEEAVMKIMDFLNQDAVTADLQAKGKEEAIRELVDLLAKAGVLKEKDKLVKILLSREALGSTGIGQGVGIPHGKCDGVKELVAAFALSPKGVNFDSLDGEPVHIFFLLVAPQDSAGPHLKALARISRLLKDRVFRESLKQCKDEKSILRLIEDEDTKRH